MMLVATNCDLNKLWWLCWSIVVLVMVLDYSGIGDIPLGLWWTMMMMLDNSDGVDRHMWCFVVV